MKPHYPGLDGLRGVAALAVVTMHLVGIFRPGLGPTIHASIAVDLFFMLSGFVLAFAYDARLDDSMRWSAFMTLRVLRLYPMIVLAALASALLVALKQILRPGASVDEPLLLIPAALLLLPTALLGDQTGPFTSSADLIPFVGPGWSLLWEFVASALFASRWRRDRATVALVGGLAVALAVLTLAANGLTTLGREGFVGVPGGFARVIVPFAIGVWLFRKRAFDLFPRIPVSISVLMGGALCMLPLGAAPAFDLVSVFALFPLIICLSAQVPHSVLTTRACATLGALSYPLYLLHVPVARIIGFVAKAAVPSISADSLIGLTMAGSIVASFLTLHFFDAPVRRWLATLLRRSAARRTAAAESGT